MLSLLFVVITDKKNKISLFLSLNDWFVKFLQARVADCVACFLYAPVKQGQ